MKKLSMYLEIVKDLKENTYGLSLENRKTLLEEIKRELSDISCNPSSSCEFCNELFYSMQIFHIKCEYLDKCLISDVYSKINTMSACPFASLLNDVKTLKLK